MTRTDAVDFLRICSRHSATTSERIRTNESIDREVNSIILIGRVPVEPLRPVHMSSELQAKRQGSLRNTMAAKRHKKAQITHRCSAAGAIEENKAAGGHNQRIRPP
jgi:hypothetical protein